MKNPLSKQILVLCVFTFVFFLSGEKSAFSINPNFSRNLLTNPGAETGDLSGWTILANGGDGWIVRGNKARTGQYSFQTSYAWARKYQIIDLLAEGFTQQELDDAYPVLVSDWFSGFGVNPSQTLDYGQLKVELRDASQNVIASYDSGIFRTPQAPTPYGTNYVRYSHIFENYGTGLRYIYFEHGGNDTEFWRGHYGTLIDNSFVKILHPEMVPLSPWAIGVSLLFISVFILFFRRGI